MVGDFNIHHPLPNPLRSHSAEELATSFPYFSRSSKLGFSLLNQPGVYTRFPLSGSGRLSVLDLSFASPLLLPFCQTWDIPLPSTGSDHVPVQIILSHSFTYTAPPSPNWSLTDWPALVPLLKDLTVPPPPSHPTRLSLEAWFDRHLSCLTTLLTSHTPTKRPSYCSKPLWSPLFSLPRKEFHSTTRKARSSHLPADYATANLSKKGYFKAIKAAKAAHWRSLLASATPRSIWTVKKLSLGRLAPRFPSLPDATTPTQINDALLNHFFRPQPLRPLLSSLRPFADCTSLTAYEVSAALTKCSPSSAPGPDTIPYSVWNSLHRIAPDILTTLLSPLLLFGHHSSSMKMANGVVLDKPGKPSYNSPSSFRIVVLLPTISKILERIVASSLSAIDRYVGLLHRNQCGSLPSLPPFDACTALTDTVRTLQPPAHKVSSLFLDIKGGFDIVDPDILCSSLRSKGVNHYLISWVRSFLTGRSCRILFQGSPRVFSPVSVGTPQGPPVSPLLFVIYVAPLHIPLSRGLVLSYFDDFSLSISSPSYRTNSRSLQAAFGRIRGIAHSRKVDFSVPKTELIHWRTPLQRDPPGTLHPPLVALDGQLFHPSKNLRWLGYWFVPNLASSAHFSRRLALSQAAFSSVRRLSDAGKGVSPHLCHRLAYCLLFPILSYSADLFTPTKGLLNKMEVHLQQGQRWVTNCFQSTHVPILAAKSLKQS